MMGRPVSPRASSSSRRGPRPVAERGSSTGTVSNAFLDITGDGRTLTAVLVKPNYSHSSLAELYYAWGCRQDLLDETHHGQQVLLGWCRYEGGYRRYIDHVAFSDDDSRWHR